MKHGCDNGCPGAQKGARLQFRLESRLYMAKCGGPSKPPEGGTPNCDVAAHLALDTCQEKGIAAKKILIRFGHRA
jgi:hypothetical protein